MLYFRNIFLWLNMGVMTVIGQDPRKTISAFLELNAYRREWIRVLKSFVNKIYDSEQINPEGEPSYRVSHTEYAAHWWKLGQYKDRSLWWRVDYGG